MELENRFWIRLKVLILKLEDVWNVFSGVNKFVLVIWRGVVCFLGWLGWLRFCFVFSIFNGFLVVIFYNVCYFLFG